MLTRKRWAYLVLNASVFSLCYTLSNAFADSLPLVPSVAMDWERALPFLPWMIVPYLSSGVFFAGSFFWVRTPEELRVLSQRLLLCTVLGCLIFVLWPLRLNSERPNLEGSIWSPLFGYLKLVDRPFNQLPSLHVAYCVVFWVSLRSRLPALAQIAFGLWLALVAIATLFTYQHHLLDVIAGALLGLVAIRIILPTRPGQSYLPAVSLHYALAAGVVSIVGIALHLPGFAVYPACSLLLVSAAYWRGNAHFLGKRRGRFPLWSLLLYAPYLFGYWLTWQLVRWRDREKPVLTRITEHLLISRRLTQTESMLLPTNCAVIDLANELSELGELRERNYQHFALLDLRPVGAELSRAIVAAITSEVRANRSVLLHCAMGYSRSRVIAVAYLASIKE